MNFYVTWTEYDPFYWKYDKNCHVLISTMGVRGTWQIKNSPVQPEKVMIDSGGFHYISPEATFPSQKNILQRQIKMLAGCKIPAVLCHLDYPVTGNLSIREKNRRIETTISNAYEFKYLLEKKTFDFPVEVMATVQGYDINSLRFCAKELQRIGYKYFGIGSLAVLYRPEEIFNRIKAVYEVVGDNIHIFGVSSVKIIKKLKKELPIRSFDSTRPVKAALYSAVLYNRPEYGQYFIEGNRGLPPTKEGRRKILKEPKYCPCPVCKKDSSIIMKGGKKIYTNARAIHNYFQLKEAFGTIEI